LALPKRFVNRARLAGRIDLDTLTLAQQLVVIERRLAQVLDEVPEC
jgi:hypothetical protein